jgi:hypothetical protein
MSNFDLDIKEEKLNALIGNTVKSMISNLYEEHSFLVEKKLAIKKHKSISQDLMYYCKKYMDFQPQANLASKSAILAEIQKSLEELELCEKDLDRYDTSLWKAPTHYDLHLQKTP